MDIPDPYVTVTIKTSPHGVQKTKHKDNDINPVWDETFKFYLNPAIENEVGKSELCLFYGRKPVTKAQSPIRHPTALGIVRLHVLRI